MVRESAFQELQSSRVIGLLVISNDVTVSGEYSSTRIAQTYSQGSIR